MHRNFRIAVIALAAFSGPSALACNFCMLAQGISPYLTATGNGVTLGVDYRELDKVYNQTQAIDSQGKKEAWTVFSVAGFFALSDDLTVLIALPYSIKANVDLDDTTGLNTGTITTGIGDMTFAGRYTLLRSHSPEATFMLGVLGGIKLPTGTTNNRDAQGNPVDRHALPGTGSFDFDLGLSTYMTKASGFQFTADVNYRLSGTGKWAERDHKFGNTLNYATRAFYRVARTEAGSAFYPFFGVSGETTGHEVGADNEDTGLYDPNQENHSTGGTVLFADFGLYSVLGSSATVNLGFSKAFYHLMHFEPDFEADPAENYKIAITVTYFAL